MTARRQPADCAVVRADDADIEVLSQVIADAFTDLAPCQWLIDDLAARREILPGFFSMYVEHAMADGIVYTTAARSAAALWIPTGPDGPGQPDGYDGKLAEVTGQWAERFVTFDQELDARHLTGVTHHHLAVLAVRPDRQGRGIGTGLLDAHHAILDESGIVAYLEASDERTRGIYLRHGYTDHGSSIELPGGPFMYPMIRHPRTTGESLGIRSCRDLRRHRHHPPRPAWSRAVFRGVTLMSALAPHPRPAPEPPARWRFPVPQRHRLDNGVAVFLHHLPGQHVATVICHLGVPADAEPEGCEGIAAVMAASLFAGAQGATARRCELEAAAAGITWKADAGWTGPVITLELPAAQLAEALDLLRLALAEPAFQPAGVTGQIQLAAASLTQAAASPQARVKHELPAAIYGNGGRAGRPAEGIPATVAQLAPDDIAGFYQEQVRPATTTIVIAGDLDGLDAAALASQALTTWQDDRPASRWTPAPQPLPRLQAAAVLVNQPGAAQTQLLLAAPVPGRGLSGWNELQVAAHILGAPITGHLAAWPREDAGHSYGLRAGLIELVPGTGLLVAGGAVAAEATISALGDIRDILTRPLRDPIDPGECATAAEAVTRMMPLEYETPAQVATATADLAACGLRADYPDLMLDDIAILTSSHVTGAYRSYISPDRLVLIAVGDAAALAGQLHDLELAGPAKLQVMDS